jgi:phage shock protein A
MHSTRLKETIMSIIDRIRRVAEANINHLLDRADTPEAALEAKVLELGSTIEEAKTAVAGFAVTHKRLERDIASLQQTREEWHRQAADAVKRGDDAVARRALGERAKVTDRLARLEPALDSSSKTYGGLKNDLVRLHDQLVAARAKLRELQSRRRAATAQKAFGERVDGMAADRSETEFGRFEDQVVEEEAAAEIGRELRGETTPLAARLQAQDEAARVESELEALKRELESD